MLPPLLLILVLILTSALLLFAEMSTSDQRSAMRALYDSRRIGRHGPHVFNLYTYIYG